MAGVTNYRNGPQRTASDRNGYRSWLITASVQVRAQDYNRGFSIIRHNIPKVAENHSFGILRHLTSDNKAIVFTKDFSLLLENSNFATELNIKTNKQHSGELTQNG